MTITTVGPCGIGIVVIEGASVVALIASVAVILVAIVALLLFPLLLRPFLRGGGGVAGPTLPRLGLPAVVTGPPSKLTSLAMALLDGIPVVWVVGDMVKVAGFPKTSPWLSKDCSNSAAEVSVGTVVVGAARFPLSCCANTLDTPIIIIDMYIPK